MGVWFGLEDEIMAFKDQICVGVIDVFSYSGVVIVMGVRVC